MKKHFVIILTILLGVSLANAQKIPLKNPSRVFHLRRPANLTNTVQRAAVQQTAVQTSLPQSMSTTALFHRAGNMEFWHAPVALPALEAKPQVLASPAKRSRESLELEATAYDMPAHVAEGLSRDELQEWLGTYLSFRNITQGIISRQAQSLPVTNLTQRGRFNFSAQGQYAAAKKWAESQPDYFEENYVPVYQSADDPNFTPFTVPDNAPYRDQRLRILVVNDEPWVYQKLKRELADPNVSVGWAPDAEEAEAFLIEYPQGTDVILLDLSMEEGYGMSTLNVPMYVYNHHLNIPVISYSNQSTDNIWLLSYNIVGQHSPVMLDFEMPEFVAYLKNIVYTGRARPQ